MGSPKGNIRDMGSEIEKGSIRDPCSALTQSTKLQMVWVLGGSLTRSAKIKA